MKIIRYLIQRFLLAVRDILDIFCRFQEVAILAYHSTSSSNTDIAIASEDFERHLSYLKSCGHEFVPLADIVEWRAGNKQLPRKSVALTFDDGYADFETAALPILQKYAAPATLFIVGDEVASRLALGNAIPLLSPSALERVRANPLVEEGFHSMTHTNLSRLSGEMLEAECRALFPMRFFAYPGGNHSPAAVEAVEKLGYTAACSIGMNLVRKTSNPYLLPRSVILKDMPLWRVRFATTQAIHWYRLATRYGKS